VDVIPRTEPPAAQAPGPPHTVFSFFFKNMRKILDITKKRDIYIIVHPQKSGKNRKEGAMKTTVYLVTPNLCGLSPKIGIARKP
jgi:hypothetical protein